MNGHFLEYRGDIEEYTIVSGSGCWQNTLQDCNVAKHLIYENGRPSRESPASACTTARFKLYTYGIILCLAGVFFSWTDPGWILQGKKYVHVTQIVAASLQFCQLLRFVFPKTDRHEHSQIFELNMMSCASFQEGSTRA